MLRLDQIEFAPNFQALSAFRILFALYLLAQFAFALPYYGDFYGPAGLMPLAALTGDTGVAGVATLAPVIGLIERAGLAALVPVLYPVSLVALALGWRTRWAAGVALACACFFFWRNPYLVSGAEILARLLLIWGLFVPLNRYWSVDAALDPRPRRRAWPALPFFALRLQIASLYFFSGLFKLEGAPWRQGYALAWTLRDDLYAATPAGEFFAHFPGLLAVAGYAVMALQLSFPYLIYSPWRNGLTRAAAIALSAAMHLSFIVFLRIGGFPYLCLIMLVLLVPDAWFDRMLRGRRERLRAMTVYFEPGCGFCEKVARLLREFCLAPGVPVRPSSSNRAAHALLRRHNSWVVIGADGKPRLEWRAVAYVLARSPLTAPLGWLTDLPALRPAFAALYRGIGARRRAFGKLTARLLPLRSDRPPGRRLLALNGALAALALFSNLISLDQWAIDRPRQEIHSAAYRGVRSGIDEFLAVLQVRQGWALFAPVPTHSLWRYGFAAAAPGGGTAPLALRFYRAAADGAPHFASLPWVQVFSRLELFSDSDWRALGAYLCREAAPASSVTLDYGRKPAPSPIPGGSVFSTRRSFSCTGAAL